MKVDFALLEKVFDRAYYSALYSNDDKSIEVWKEFLEENNLLDQYEEWKKNSVNSQEENDKPVQVGTLNKRWGLKDCHVAEPGHPVYQLRDRYIIVLKPLNANLPDKEVPFYMDELKPAINFYGQNS